MSAVDVTIEARQRPGPSWETRGASRVPDVSGVPLGELVSLDEALGRVVPLVEDVPLEARFGSAI